VYVVPYMILAFPENSRLEGGSMCLIFCLKLADRYFANFCNVDSSFGREENEKNSKFFIFFLIQKWCDL
jgi:hypothetical protein